MTITMWVIGGIIGLCGLFITVMNWLVFVNNAILRRPWTSAVPIIGGILIGISMALLPINGLWKWAWIGLVIDWGGLPIVIWSLMAPKDKNGDVKQEI